jgi:hypothetical protein
MKCQACNKAATLHVTEVVSGEPVEYHVCEEHLPGLNTLKPASGMDRAAGVYTAFWEDAKLREVLKDSAAQQEVAVHILAALCISLRHEKPEVRIVTAYQLMEYGSAARSTIDALRAALQDPDERVQKAARLALEYIESDQAPSWWRRFP